VSRFIIGDLLTGRRINNLPVVTGTWSAPLNAAGDVSCTVTLRDPDVRGLALRVNAAPGRSFLAAVDGDTVNQAGPIWLHDYNRDAQTVTLTASGMWSYFDHRVLIPVLAGRLPTDPSTDTNFANSSLHDIARALVAQAQSWTAGSVPVILPATVAGTGIRNYKGADLGLVGERLTELTKVIDGPDIRFAPQFTSDKLGIQWKMLVGTPAKPLLASPMDVVFTPTASTSSVTGLTVSVDATSLASQAFASGGQTADEALAAMATDPTLTNAGYPLLEVVDSSHQSVALAGTLASYVLETLHAGRTPVETWSFDHDPTAVTPDGNVIGPALGAFNVGDFARVRMRDDPYIADGEHRMRITQLSGTHLPNKITLAFQPEVVV
jgi:hypothetical protein